MKVGLPGIKDPETWSPENRTSLLWLKSGAARNYQVEKRSTVGAKSGKKSYRFIGTGRDC